MPDIISNNSGLNWINGTTSQYFSRTSTQATNNATIIFRMLTAAGWTKTAIAAMLGNIFDESTLNPNLQQRGGPAYGLVQWDPPSKMVRIANTIYPEGYDRSNGTVQLNVVYAEFQQTCYAYGDPGGVNRGIGQQWYKSSGTKYGFSLPPTSWYNFAHDDSSGVEALTKIWMVSYERPSYNANINHWRKRVEDAKYFLELIGGIDPGGGTGDGRFFPSTSSGTGDSGGGKIVSNKEIIKAVQAILKGAGHYSGSIDGIMGPKTRAALKSAGVT